MPAVYAHRRFGGQVLAVCENPMARAAIRRFPVLYQIGLQGPDLLFYCDPLGSNPCKDAGNAMHDAPAAPFFEAAAARVNGLAEGQAVLSYLLGFVCHFALDSECHSYVEYEIQRSGHGHIAIETALEGALMDADGVDWTTHNPAGYIAVNETNVRVIARILPASRQQIRTSLANMKRMNRLLMPSCKTKNYLTQRFLELAGKWDVLGGLLIYALDRPAYARSSARLAQLAEGAVPVALDLMDSLCDHIAYGTPLSSRFDRTYGPVPELMQRYAEEDS